MGTMGGKNRYARSLTLSMATDKTFTNPFHNASNLLKIVKV